ncbi:hypothetical protein BH18ACT4_BH18ACT4_06350 [soil metagenome]
MSSRPVVYGLDIETDTTVDGLGLDPSMAAVVTVALSHPRWDEIFTGPEVEILAELDARVAEFQPDRRSGTPVPRGRLGA